MSYVIGTDTANFMVTFRTKKSVKEKAVELFEKMGLDMSSALNLFLYNVVIKKAIPFDIVTENGYTPEQESKILGYSKELEGKSFKNTKELMNYLNS